ncbi:plexin domain-containing protein 2 [Onthophagus taurus]|uniref:plexin domain-containing protein 2 n=1 Tax=Onthophagus taurus TaxID=166361 RepID=UPI000C2018AA|nr:plexin domain-containing protein 2 [Onthophagus taurus]
MAKSVCYERIFLVYSLVILSLLQSYLAKDIYFYTSDNSIPKHKELIDFQLINQPEINHNIQRREVNNGTTLQPGIPTNNNTTKKVYVSEKKNNKKQIPMINTEAPPLTVKKNLGENGTGTLWANATKPMLTKVMGNLNVTKNSLSLPDYDDDCDHFENFDNLTKYFEHNVKDGNYSVNKSDTHIYYNSTFTTFPHIGKYWVNFDNDKAIIHSLLSTSHRRAATVKLNFDFPFYGHMIRNVTVATGGFIYTGDYVHSWLAATQYIAPLMANFDTSLSNDSYIKILDNGTSFTVQWENVRLQDNPKDDKFTFQATLHKNGDIVFSYLNVPEIIKSIQDVYHPVTIGLSDAYIIDNAEHYVHRKTIFEYHKVSFAKEDIKNSTVIYLTALPTCQQKRDCKSCFANDDTNFKCTWCLATSRCSSGVDRYRHEWLQKGCDKKQIFSALSCESLYTTDDDDDHGININNGHQEALNDMLGLRPINAKSQNNSMGSISILFVAFVCISTIIVLWMVYAYRNPHTTSGQMLIRYRPSQWRWRRGEARYTAATIHM